MDSKLPKGLSVINAKPTTTFVHVDTATFREVVQRLTSETDHNTATAATMAKNDKIPPTLRRATSTSKLHERRKYLTKPKLEIVKSKFHCTSGSAQLSPSFTSGDKVLLPSPVTPSTLFSQLLILEHENKRDLSTGLHDIDREEEEKAIKQKRFYLHPSPRSKPGFVEPELLNLFPLTSPKTEAN